EEILELDRYCRERFVELVPNQNTFGHMERWLHRPRYEHLAENMPGMPIQYYLCPSDPRSLQLVEELLDELLPHFTSRQAMVGLDEVRLGAGGRSAALCEERGSPEQVYLDYLKAVHRIVRRHGRTMMYFADMVVQHDLVSQVPGDAVGLIWGYDEEYPFREHCARYADAGIPFYPVPGTCCHTSIGGRTGLAMRNMAAAVASALEFGGSGTLVANWGDGGHWQPLTVTMVGYAYGAGVMWGLHGNRDADLAAALDAHLYQDEAQVTGRVSVDLGRACQQLPALADWTAYQTILQQKPGGHEELARIEPRELEGAGEFVARTLEPLGRASMGCSDAGIVAGELRVAAGLMRHACHLALTRFQAVGTRLPDLPEGWGISHILPENRTPAERAAERCYYWPERPGDAEIPTYGSDRLRPLADEMEQVLADYRRTWLARNRPGGLDESAARFDRLLQLYRQGMQG
ncbi:MAG: family 20 glycosylhydrolase, partial [Gemmatimonadetes bacterium]|nr:family 20 glycosylhydrolase [Gemmatimonadota bacterium]